MIARIKYTFVTTFLAICILVSATAHAGDPESAAMNMVDAWNDVDLDRVIELFTEDGTLHSMMMHPIVGRENLRRHLKPLFAGIDELNLQLKHVVVDGDTVLIERIDEFVFNGKRGSVPVFGVLLIRDGRVAEWREYYDRAQLYSEMGIPVPSKNAAAASTH